MKPTRIALTALGVLALAACGTAGGDTAGSPAEKAQPDDLRGNTYAIESVQGESKTEKLMKDSKLAVEFTEDDRINVLTDCNQLSGEVGFDGDTLKVDRLAGTLMGCEETPTAQEKWANELFTAGPEWGLDGKELNLTADGTTVTFTEKK